MFDQPQHKLDETKLVSLCEKCGEKHCVDCCETPQSNEFAQSNEPPRSTQPAYSSTMSVSTESAISKETFQQSEANNPSETTKSIEKDAERKIDSVLGTQCSPNQTLETVLQDKGDVESALNSPESRPRCRRSRFVIELTLRQKILLYTFVVMFAMVLVAPLMVSRPTAKSSVGHWEGNRWVIDLPHNVSVKQMLESVDNYESMIVQGMTATPRMPFPYYLTEYDSGYTKVALGRETFDMYIQSELAGMGAKIIPDLLAYLGEPKKQHRDVSRYMCVYLLAAQQPKSIDATLDALNKCESNNTFPGGYIDVLRFTGQTALERIEKLALSSNPEERKYGMRTLLQFLSKMEMETVTSLNQNINFTGDVPNHPFSVRTIVMGDLFGFSLQNLILSPAIETSLVNLARNAEENDMSDLGLLPNQVLPVRESAVKGLALILPSNGNIVNTLADLTSDSDLNVVRAAIDSLGYAIYKDGEPRFTVFADRSTAVVPIGWISQQNVERAIAAIARQRDGCKNVVAQDKARKALCWIARVNPKHAEVLVEAMRNGAFGSSRNDALLTAQAIGEPAFSAVFDELVKIIRSDNDQDRESAIALLGSLSKKWSSRAVPVLIDCIEGESARHSASFAADHLTVMQPEFVKPYKIRLQSITLSSNPEASKLAKQILERFFPSQQHE